MKTLAPITDQNVWEDFVRAQKPHSFLHSWKWGQQYEQSGSRIFRFGVYEEGGMLAAVALFIYISARRGAFLLCPHGPVFSAGVTPQEILSLLVAAAEKQARELGCAFIRVCPLLADTPENKKIFQGLGFQAAPIHMHPELAWMLNITKPEDELLRGMRKTTRYLIRKTEKQGVTIEMSTDVADFAKFWPVYEETFKRQKFTPFSQKYLRQEFELFAEDDAAALFFARYEGEIIAASMIIFYGNAAFYHHSGSVHRFEKMNGSYLLQWRVIQEAKRRGCEMYNFWGIAPDNVPKHPWAGLSLFKKGFGGFAEKYVPAQDKKLSAKYYLNFVVESVRRRRRGF